MPKKTIIIFISVFVIVGAIVLVFSLLTKKDGAVDETTSTPWYQSFNPFGVGDKTDEATIGETINDQGQGQNVYTQNSKFFQVTDFAIAGATFLEDTRPVVYDNKEIFVEPTQNEVVINANTKEGRKEIQAILNSELSLEPPLVLDGSFGKLAIQAIKDFQKLKGVPVTGKIDTETAPLFTKTTEVASAQEEERFESVPSVRYVERMNGHIHKMFLDTKVKEKISNSTIPSIYEALFDKSGQSVIYRYLSNDKSISSFMATLGAEKGEFLPQNITDLSVSPDKTKFFYLTENSNGVVGTIGMFDKTTRSVVFNSSFTEWLSQWATSQKIFLTTKPAYGVNGSIFILNTATKTITKVFGGVGGLTTLVNPNGTLILYSNSTETGPKLGIFDIEKHSTKDLKLYGLPEKCIWAEDNIYLYCALPNVITGNQYPDSWYQGLVSFDDYFVKIDSLSGEVSTIANSNTETVIDATHLFLDNTEDLLFFTNKKDSTLWSLRLK
jgi:hypothetical protein